MANLALANTILAVLITPAAPATIVEAGIRVAAPNPTTAPPKAYPPYFFIDSKKPLGFKAPKLNLLFTLEATYLNLILGFPGFILLKSLFFFNVL